MHQHIDLEELESMVWNLFRRCVRDRKRGFHYLNIATTNEDNIPTVRTVILRKVSEEQSIICFHTDARSRKYNHLQENSIFGIHVYDSKSNLQVYIQAKASLHHMDDIAALVFESLSPHAKALYNKSTPPMTIIEQPNPINEATDNATSGFENFVWVEANILSMEILHLGRDMHRKMVISLKNGKKKYWVEP